MTTLTTTNTLQCYALEVNSAELSKFATETFFIDNLREDRRERATFVGSTNKASVSSRRAFRCGCSHIFRYFFATEGIVIFNEESTTCFVNLHFFVYEGRNVVINMD
jgi:hypothetical protein